MNLGEASNPWSWFQISENFFRTLLYCGEQGRANSAYKVALNVDPFDASAVAIAAAAFLQFGVTSDQIVVCSEKEGWSIPFRHWIPKDEEPNEEGALEPEPEVEFDEPENGPWFADEE